MIAGDPPASRIVDVATRSDGSIGLLPTAMADLKILRNVIEAGLRGDLSEEEIGDQLWRIEERIELVRDALVGPDPVPPGVIDLAARRKARQP